jgi:hypothetical protein
MLRVILEYCIWKLTGSANATAPPNVFSPASVYYYPPYCNADSSFGYRKTCKLQSHVNEPKLLLRPLVRCGGLAVLERKWLVWVVSESSIEILARPIILLAVLRVFAVSFASILLPCCTCARLLVETFGYYLLCGIGGFHLWSK